MNETGLLGSDLDEANVAKVGHHQGSFDVETLGTARKLACQGLSYQGASETVPVSQLLLKSLYIPAMDFPLYPTVPRLLSASIQSPF